ncbi:hypothetical protein N8156_04340 [Rhodospirillaceae bacterium]|nr:hypothetical protein [Rhodospirillaceae bacterium]
MAIMQFSRPFYKSDPIKRGWVNQEVAEFYRVVDLLRKSGLGLEVDSGLTDEGEPWFIFAREETGDVLAHFARINGKFIAVSSLTQEIYSGRDVRSVINQMLERHPLLLPQNGTNNTLFLHPTAALTAFVAAAFILSIDSVKAKTLEDVVEVFSGPKDAVPSNFSVDVKALIAKVEVLRSGLADVMSGNINIAALGAALIHYENIDSERLEIDHDKAMLANEKIKPFLIFTEAKWLPSDFHGEMHDGLLEIKAPDDVNLSSSSAMSLDILLEQDNSHNKQAGSIFHGEDILGDVMGLDMAHISDSIEDTYIGVPKFTASAPFFQTVPIVSFLPKMENKKVSQPTERDGAFLDLVEGVYRVFEQAKVGADLKKTAPSEKLGVAFGTEGDITVLAFEHLKQDQKVILSDFAASHSKDDKNYNISFDMNVNIATTDDFSLQDHPPQSDIVRPEQKQFVAHNLMYYGTETLLLSNSVDLVIYNGGHSKLDGFELGKDVLFFFVPSADLDNSYTIVENHYDIKLMLGDTGSLTFINLLQDLAVPDLII